MRNLYKTNLNNDELTSQLLNRTYKNEPTTL